MDFKIGNACGITGIPDGFDIHVTVIFIGLLYVRKFKIIERAMVATCSMPSNYALRFLITPPKTSFFHRKSQVVCRTSLDYSIARSRRQPTTAITFVPFPLPTSGPMILIRPASKSGGSQKRGVLSTMNSVILLDVGLCVGSLDVGLCVGSLVLETQTR